MVGSRRLELPTSSVSRKRSNQLSYEPTACVFQIIPSRLILLAIRLGGGFRMETRRILTGLSLSTPAKASYQATQESSTKTGSLSKYRAEVRLVRGYRHRAKPDEAEAGYFGGRDTRTLPNLSVRYRLSCRRFRSCPGLFTWCLDA